MGLKIGPKDTFRNTQPRMWWSVEVAGWHHWLDGHEFVQALGVGDGQGGLACCGSWGRRESAMTERLNWTEPPSWTSFPPPIPSHSFRLSQSTGFELSASHSEYPPAIYCTYVNVYVSILLSPSIRPPHFHPSLCISQCSLWHYFPELGHRLPWWLSWWSILLQCRRPGFHPWVGKIPWRRERRPTPVLLGFLCGSAGKESTCNAGHLGSIPGLGRSLEKGKATHSRILAWRVPWTVQSMESQSVRHNWMAFTFIFHFQDVEAT